MRAPYITPASQVNKSLLPHNNISAGSTIRFVRAWREDELPGASNFPVALITGVRQTANGFSIYETTEGDVWFDRVQEVIEEAARVEDVLAA
jgi:hypothetical protein